MLCLAGVLNTDNMSILGLTLDYGPYGFMDTCAPACPVVTPPHLLLKGFAIVCCELCGHPNERVCLLHSRPVSISSSTTRALLFQVQCK